jgi:hypothetical protein
LYEIAGAWTQRSTIKGVRVMGNPFWKHHARGILDWIVILAILSLSFVAQWLDFISGVTLWWYVAGAYTGLVVIHAVITQRDGYTVSLMHGIGRLFRRCGLIPLAWLFEWIGASSARPPAEQYLAPYHLKVGLFVLLHHIIYIIIHYSFSQYTYIPMHIYRLGGLVTLAICSSGFSYSVAKSHLIGLQSCKP